MRAMAKREAATTPDGADPALVELKAVDPSVYPVFGALETEPREPVARMLALRGDVFGLIADPLLIARLDAKIGDLLTIGAARFEIRAILRARAGQALRGRRLWLARADFLRRAQGHRPGAARNHRALHRAPRAAGQSQRRGGRGRRRRVGRGLSAGRLGHSQARRGVAAVLAQSRTLLAVVDAGGAHRSGRRRRRSRQCGARADRTQARRLRGAEGAGGAGDRASSPSR